jgi:Fe-S-cluster-containing hydrogenase component 2
MEAYGGPAQPSPTIAQCLNGGYGWLQVKCHHCETEASIPLDAIRRPRDTPIWKLEAALKCRSCKKGRHAPPVHTIRLTLQRETMPYVWTHPDDDDRRKLEKASAQIQRP